MLTSCEAKGQMHENKRYHVGMGMLYKNAKVLIHRIPICEVKVSIT